MPSTALLIPCYNAVRFLSRLREQVDRLSPAFDEVLLADDASTDDTVNHAESLGFQVICLSKNRGPGAARNALARSSRAEWIHFHDVDDELAPDYLAQITACPLDDHDVVFHFTDFIDEVSRDLVVRWTFSPDKLIADPARTLLLSPLPTVSSFMRRSVFLDIGGFDEERRCFEDGDLHFRLACSGVRITGLPHVLEWSLRRHDGLSANQTYCLQCRLAFLEDYATTQPARLHPSIAQEAERVATHLLRLGDGKSARRAIVLAERLGRVVPTTRNPLFRALRTIVPKTILLRWQDRWRNR